MSENTIKTRTKRKDGVEMTAMMKKSFGKPMAKVGARVVVRKDSGCSYADRTLIVKNVYSRNGNKCVDLCDKEGELMVVGMDFKYLKKAR